MKIANALLLFATLVLIALPAAANPLPDPWCDWEHGETAFYTYGTGEPAIYATSEIPPEPAPNYEGGYALRLEDGSPSGTPYAVVAYVYGLGDGDQVTVGFWRYDITPGMAPSCRIWGHWNDSLPSDLAAYDGTAGGNEDYGPGTGWDYVEHTWTVSGGHTGLAVEVRTYSNPGDVVWIDNLYVEPAPDRTIWTPCLLLVETQEVSFGAIKSLYR